MTPESRYDVFLSYNSADQVVVEVIAQMLRAARLNPFFAPWHLVAGEPWQEALEKGLDDSKTCAVFLGPKGVGSWENEEMRSALDARTRNRLFRAIPVLLPGSRIPEHRRLPRFLSLLTWVDFRGGLDDEQALHRLLSGIRGIPPGPLPAERDKRLIEKPPSELKRIDVFLEGGEFTDERSKILIDVMAAVLQVKPEDIRVADGDIEPGRFPLAGNRPAPFHPDPDGRAGLHL